MLIALLIASVTDIKKKEIPILLFPSFTVMFLIVNHATISIINSLLGFFIGLVAFSFLAWKFSGGGGDIIMMSCLGAAYGARILSYVIVLSSFIMLFYYLLRKDKDKKLIVPYAPFVTLSFIILVLFGGMIYGFTDNRFLENCKFLL